MVVEQSSLWFIETLAMIGDTTYVFKSMVFLDHGGIAPKESSAILYVESMISRKMSEVLPNAVLTSRIHGELEMPSDIEVRRDQYMQWVAIVAPNGVIGLREKRHIRGHMFYEEHVMSMYYLETMLDLEGIW